MINSAPVLRMTMNDVASQPSGHDGNDAMELSSPHDSSKKRRKLSGDERLTRNRERNRIHARKTRERKRNQTAALQSRINELYEEGMNLRRIADERYTASSLLGLSNNTPDAIPLMPSSQICDNYYCDILQDSAWLRDINGHLISNSNSHAKRVRRSGKYTPQEREKIRRERNRMHAKKTRDRKKHFLEMSEKIITEMEKEANSLRSYLLSLNLITPEEVEMSHQRVLASKLEIEHLKANHGAEDDDDDDEDDDETEGSESEMELEEIETPEVVNGENEEPSVSGSSDMNDKVSSWSGSNDGSSSNQESGAATSRETTSSRSAGSDDGNISNANSSSSMDKQYETITISNREEGDSPSYSGQTNNGSTWNEDEYRVGNAPFPSPKESYHHGISTGSPPNSIPENDTKETNLVT